MPLAPQRAPRFQPVRRTSVIAVLLACSASVLAAHDFWLIPDAFSVTPGGRVALQGQTSSLFPTSLSAVTPDRVVEARVITASAMVQVKDISVGGNALRMSFRPSSAGQHVVGVQLKPRSIRESPASFRRYLDLEGAPEARQRYELAGLLGTGDGDSLTRRYAKYAKTILEVGRGARAFHRPHNHPMEFLPLSDPAALRVGDTLRVRLLLLGQPAPLARLHTGSVAITPSTLVDTAAARLAARDDVSLETDRMGVADVVITRAGLWNVRTLQIVPAIKGSGADWDVHWATFVFSVTQR